MSFQRKLRKLILHPVTFFRDSRIFRSKGTTRPIQAAPPINNNQVFFTNMENNILKIINFSNSYPVNNLRWVNGQILWPAFRFYFTLLANCHVLGRLKTPRIFQPFPAFYWRKYYIENNYAIPIDKYTPQKQYDFVVFSALRSISWINEKEKIHDRLLDPLIEKLNNYGETKKILIVNTSGELPDNLAIKPDYILFPVQYTINNSYETYNFDIFASKATSYFTQYKITNKDLAYFLDIFIYLYSNYVKLLKKIRPKAIFFFPIDYSTPLIMAARSLGIHTIDIQHGNMIGYYTAYNRWDEQYKLGYDLWPDTILTWSEREKQHVQRIFKGHIKACIFGYPWLEKKQFDSQLLENKKLNNFKNKFKYIVIVSLSNHSYIPEPIDSIVKDSRAKELSIGFIFKRNPKKNKTVIPPLNNVYTDDSITYASFLSIASYADLHMTEASSCLYEADYIGLNTILTGNSWEFHFKDLVEAERVYTAQSADDFYAIFEKAVSFCHYPRLIDNHSDEFDTFMQTFMQKND